MHPAVETAVIASAFRLVDHAFEGSVQRSVEYPALPVGTAFHTNTPQRLLPDGAAPLLHRIESKPPGFGFEIGTRLLHIDIGDSHPETDLAETGRGGEPCADTAPRRRTLTGKRRSVVRPGTHERPVGDRIEILPGVIDRFPARNDPVAIHRDLAFGADAEKHVRLPSRIRKVKFIEGSPFRRRPFGPHRRLFEPDPVRPGMQFFQIVVVPRRGALRIERHFARRGHDRAHYPAAVAGHIEGYAVDPVGEIAVVESGFGHREDSHHRVRSVHLRGNGRQQGCHTADIGIDPTAYALIAAGRKTGCGGRRKDKQ